MTWQAWHVNRVIACLSAICFRKKALPFLLHYRRHSLLPSCQSLWPSVRIQHHPYDLMDEGCQHLKDSWCGIKYTTPKAASAAEHTTLSQRKWTVPLVAPEPKEPSTWEKQPAGLSVTVICHICNTSVCWHYFWITKLFMLISNWWHCDVLNGSLFHS